MTDLETFLDKKSLYYDKIDYTIINNAWKSLEEHINLPFVVHLVGTNGKGSTGRFLAHYLNKSNKKVLHYSSPHILEFNERIWINGFDVSDEVLEEAHLFLLNILEQEIIEKLTYFEYTTLLAIQLSSNFDYLVLEAGLGGEFDATNVVKNDLSIITTIDFDHESFLGNSIKEIALTKLRASDKKMIVSHQVHEEVISHVKQIAKERNLELEFFKEVNEELKDFTFPLYLLRNLSTAIIALEAMNFNIKIDFFKDVKLKARCEKISSNITIDVGHNPLAAQAIVAEFMQNQEKIVLVYNSFEDKNYEKVLEILKPIVKKVLILNIEDKRVVKREKLLNICKNLDMQQEEFVKIEIDENYLVFGSFLVVEKFLKLNKDMSI